MNIEKFCQENNLGTVRQITKLTGGLMHKMFKVETDKKVYAIKVLNQEVMTRQEAYHNFIVSEEISNLAKNNNIPVSSALKINNDYLIELDTQYYMVFDFIEGKTLKDSEIKLDHCQKIGDILAQIHNLDYHSLQLDTTITKYKRLVDWEFYKNNMNFNVKKYQQKFLENYKKYNSILKRVNERYNSSNHYLTICHRDMDPKNVMWHNNNPIIIDWESAYLANPYRELVEVALSWSGFLSNQFDENKFIAVIQEYAKKKEIANIDWYAVICGNLVGRFGWLEYNLKRSLGITSNDLEEQTLAEHEVSKTIDELNRYLELIGTMYDIFQKLSQKQDKNYDKMMDQLKKTNKLLENKECKRITAGFTNILYRAEDYIIKICTNNKQEDRFQREINFYKNYQNNTNIPKLYMTDTSKTTIPYMYEILENIKGKTLYEVWYKLSEKERQDCMVNLVEVLQTIHQETVETYNFEDFIKDTIMNLIKRCDLKDDIFTKLLAVCTIYFEKNKFYTIHGDLHFDNIIYQEGKIKILDFERTMSAPIDYEFRILNRYTETPWLCASEKTDLLTVETDYQQVMSVIIRTYQELQNIPYLEKRLEVYTIIEKLKDYEKTKDEEELDQIKTRIKKLITSTPE